MFMSWAMGRLYALSQAIAHVDDLGCSLAWLTGGNTNRGDPRQHGLRFRGDIFARLRRSRGISERMVITSLNLTLGPLKGANIRVTFSSGEGLGRSAAWPSPSSTSLFGPCSVRWYVAAAAWT
jgi:hypothetical protein